MKNVILVVGWIAACFMAWVAYELNKENIQFKRDNTVFVKEWGRTQAVRTNLMMQGWTDSQIDDFIGQGCVNYYVGVEK